MEEIDKIIALRKDYAYKLYDFYNHIIRQLPAVTNENIVSINQIVLEERNYWEQYQNRTEKLERFNQEIEQLNQKQKNTTITQNKISEIMYLRSSFEKQVEDCKKHYKIVFSKVKHTRSSVMDNLCSQLLLHSQRDKNLSYLNKNIHETHHVLKIYCDHWKSKHIENLQKISISCYEIELLCQAVSHELINFEKNEIEDEEKIYFDKLQSLFFADQCTKLSQLIEDLINNHDLFDLLSKLKTEESFLFKEEFYKLFNNKNLGSIRNNIKIINNISSTQKKINIIHQSFRKLNTILLPEVEKLKQKKIKLISLCNSAQELSKITTEKWIIAHYGHVFNSIDDILKNKNKLL